MRLLIVNYEYPPIGGGASNASLFLARSLARDGHSVSVLTSAVGAQRGLTVEDGVRVYRVLAGLGRDGRASVVGMIVFALSGILRAPRIARADEIETVLAVFSLPSGLVGYWLRKRFKLPYVVSVRGADVPEFLPELSLAHRALAWLRRAVLRRAEAVATNSQGIADLSMAHDPFPVVVIPNGVDTEMYQPPMDDAASADAACLRLLAASRLHEQKNLGLLLDELARLESAGQLAFHLDIAGQGPLLEELQSRVARLGLESRVTWHGWVSKAELIELYHRADCLVHPSIIEGTSNTVLEAMACGLPVIASRIPGLDTLVAHRETGLLFDLEQPQALGEALTWIDRDRQRARDLGRTARQVVVEDFSWQTNAEDYFKLLAPAGDRSIASG